MCRGIKKRRERVIGNRSVANVCGDERKECECGCGEEREEEKGESSGL